jgi:hypothetical protein
MQQFFMAVDALIKDFKTKSLRPLNNKTLALADQGPCDSYLMFIEHATRTPA